jgi:hypothetical protein
MPNDVEVEMSKGLLWTIVLILIGILVGIVLNQYIPYGGSIVFVIGMITLGIISLMIMLRPKYRCLTCGERFKTSREMVNHSFSTKHETLAKYPLSQPSEIRVKSEDD